MARRGEKNEEWNFTKIGSFGHFSTDISVPIQYLMTTFTIDQLSNLSFAREIQTTLNFDLLIQRDIDEERAIEKISTYISPEKNDQEKEDKIVFLPPLLAAIVTSENGKELASYYSDVDVTFGTEGADKTIVRQWGRDFKITHYEDLDGYELQVESTVKERVLIDSSTSKMQFRLAIDNNPGTRLVVIDGQHRLFAIQHLKKVCPEKVKHILMPVCILFSPNSTEGNANKSYPTVPKVLRDTFVDVNSTVEAVSGHFTILLSDRNLSSFILRTFCDEVLNTDELGIEALALIEWNTKNDKESKTISKPYSLTSIGVLADIFEAHFKARTTSTGNQLLRSLININEVIDDIDFGLDEEGEPKGVPEEFPWQEFQFKHKEILTESIRKHFVPCLIQIFFKTKSYGSLLEAFRHELGKLQDIIIGRTKQSPIAMELRDSLLTYTPISRGKKEGSVNQLLGEMIDSIEAQCDSKYAGIMRNNVFQKGMIGAWLKFCAELKRFNVLPIDLTKGFSFLLDTALDNRLTLFKLDANHSYLSGSIYNNLRISPTKATRLQIERLILGLLGNEGIAKKVFAEIKSGQSELPHEALEKMMSLGYQESSYFCGALLDSRKAVFKKNYPVSDEISDEEREQLEKAEKEFEDAKKAKLEKLPQDFENLILSKVRRDFLKSASQLDVVLGYKTSQQQFFEDVEE